MVKKEFHAKHSDGTKTKLALFDGYFNESLPVFVHSPFWKQILIFDLFAGQGKDKNGEYGTALNIIKGVSSHCKAISEKSKSVYVVLNDKKEHLVLRQNVNDFLIECKSRCSLDKCVLIPDKNLVFKGKEFKPYFDDTIYPIISNQEDSAKIVYLDPYNFVLTAELFGKLTSIKGTDFICFMPSSYLRRFKSTSAFSDFIDKDKLKFDESRPNECHRVIARYFDSLVSDKEYYIGHFSIDYGKNIYGVIFGSHHTLGAEKFQRVCWEIDKTSGEADYNIDRELIYNGHGSLFDEDKIPRKIKAFNDLLISNVKEGKIKTDIEAYKLALKHRCLPRHASEVLTTLMSEGKIEGFKTKNSDIHRIKSPQSIILL